MQTTVASHCSVCLLRCRVKRAHCTELAPGSQARSQKQLTLQNKPASGKRSHSGKLTCSAQTSAVPSRSSQVEAQRVADQLPNSKEQSIAQAAQALKLQLAAAIPKSKGFKSATTSKLTVDIPVADDSPAVVADLVSSLVQSLPKSCTDQLTIIFANDNVAHHVSEHVQLQPQALSLGDAFLERLSGIVLIVGAQQNQIEKVEVLLSQWKGRAAILLNAEWDYSSIPNQHRAFANSFESVYSFLPLDIKGFVFKTPAVIYKRVTKGSPASSPWYLFVKEGKGHRCIARQQQRLTPENLELAFYNYKAAESPITKGVKLFKGFLPQK